jgi:4-hydroxybenzoate polyprenyltransferase
MRMRAEAESVWLSAEKTGGPATEAGGRTPAPLVGQGTLASLGRLLFCIRFEDVIVLQGSPFLGALIAAQRGTAARVSALAILAAGSFCLVAHVFALNDWSGIGSDLRDPHKGPVVFESRGITRSEVGHLALALLAMGLLLLGSLGFSTLIIALAIVGLSALYSLPSTHVKGIPLLNSALHLVGGILHFLLGYSLFAAIDRRGLEIACFFGLTFAAGHLTQEVRDRDGDFMSGIRTNAVVFGKKGAFGASLGVFTLAHLVLATMAVREIVPRALLLVAGLYLLHLYWSLRALTTGLTFEAIRSLQARYRVLYAIIGFGMTLALLGLG